MPWNDKDALTPQNLNSKSGLVLNVKDPVFGAVGDGVADDTVALQAAVAAMGDNNAALFFPIGTFNFNDTLLFTGSNKTVSGAGMGTVLQWTGAQNDVGIQVGDGGITISNFNIFRDFQLLDVSGTTGVDKLFYAWSANRSKFINLKFNGITGATTGSSLVVEKTIITDFYSPFFNAGNIAVELLNDTNAVTFYSLSIENMAKYGVWNPADQFLTRINFYGGTIEALTSGDGIGFRFDHPLRSVLISGMYFEGNNQHIDFQHNPAVSGLGCIIENCRFKSVVTGTAHIELATQHVVEVSNCEFRDNPLLHLNHANAVAVLRNNHSSDGQSAISFTAGDQWVHDVTLNNGLRFNAHTIREIESGTSDVITAGSSVAVTFDQTFTAAPIVVVTHSGATTRDGPLRVSGISTTGFTLHDDATQNSQGHWVAMWGI